MQIEIQKELAEHYERIKNLAEEAANDENQSFSSRSAAMKSLTEVIKELVKTQAEVVNMARLMAIESAIIETANLCLDAEGKEQLIRSLRAVLSTLELAEEGEEE